MLEFFFLSFTVCGASKLTCLIQVHMFNSTPADISRFWSILGILELFAFSVFLFCHPFEGRDSLKKRKIHEETIHTHIHTARKASWRRVFDPYAPLLFNLYHSLGQNLLFGLVPENKF